MKFKNLVGRRFGCWKVLYEHQPAGRGQSRRWMCRCTCGAMQPVRAGDLLQGRSQRCKACRASAAAARRMDLAAERPGEPWPCVTCERVYPWQGTAAELAEVRANLEGMCPQCARRSGLLDEEVETPGQTRKRARRRRWPAAG